MSPVKKSFVVFVLCLVLAAGSLYTTANGNYPTLQNGDLVFQTSTSNQSSAILVATADPFTHMGIIKKNEKISL